MKRTLIIAMLLISPILMRGQILKPVKWSYAAKKNKKNDFIILLKATIDEGWHIYSSYQSDGGPIKTSFVFAPSKDFKLVGKVTEPEPVTKYEKTFEMNVKYFANSVIFQQKIKLENKDALVNGKLEYMVCNDQKCLPPETVSFSIPVK